MSFWIIILLGVVEGVTEFLPVSSTGHLLLAEHALRLEVHPSELFNVVIQSGAVLAVLLAFAGRLGEMARHWRSPEVRSYVAKLVVAFVITAVGGLALKKLDLMPADITGTDIIQEDPTTGHRRFVFQKGPIFTQMLLADEINRTPPKTQAALLEAMQERSVTVGGHTLHLDKPFFVLATQNPIEQEGTYPLPEAQRDRFLFLVKVEYPSRDEERQIIARTTGTFSAEIRPVIEGPQILELQKVVRKVPVPDHVMDFVLDLVRYSRPDNADAPEFVKDLIEWGAGPRACQNLVLAGKVRAVLHGRFHVTIDDIVALAPPVLRHRIVPTFNAEAEGVKVDDIIARIIEVVPRGESGQVL